MLRRAADVACAAVLLCLSAPIVLAAAVAIRLTSRGPALFCQRRIGESGVPFTMYKLRTMREDAGRGPMVLAVGDDPRVTRLGRFLRLAKIDELPQLVNVLKGEMTLIGPRAETPELAARFTDAQREVLRVRPGLTGPGQILYTTTLARELEGARDRNRRYLERILPRKIEADLSYLRARTLRGDLAILARTLTVVFTLGKRG